MGVFTPIPVGTENWDVPLNAALTAIDNEAATALSTANTAVVGLGGKVSIDTIVYNVKDHGAVGDGVTDDAAAINALITSVTTSPVGATIHFPGGVNGTYRISTPLTPTVGMRFTGSYGATIVAYQSDVFNFGSHYMHPGQAGQPGIIEVDHLILDATGGHVFNNANINQGSFHDLICYARSSNKGIWNSATTLLWIKFENIISSVYGATRSVPGWSVKGVSTADVANLTWNHCLFQNLDGDNTQYQVLLQADSGSSARTYHEQNAFRDCYFERPFGGAVKSLSGQGTVFDGCRVYDIFTGFTVGNSLFYIGQATNSTWPSTNTRFTSNGRDLQGPDGSATYDILLESTCLQTTIENYDVRDIPGTFTGHPFINLNNSVGVTLINNRAQTLTNANGAGFWNITSDGTLSGAGNPSNYSATDTGYAAWTYDPTICNAGTSPLPTGGTVYLSQVLVRAPKTISNLVLNVNAAGVTLTASQNFAGIYNSAGTQLGVTADQSAVWNTTGCKNMPLAGGATTLTPGFYWIAFVSNGTTIPSFARASGVINAQIVNGQLGSGQYRFATNGAGATTLPASFTPSANVSSNLPNWAACY